MAGWLMGGRDERLTALEREVETLRAGAGRIEALSGTAADQGDRLQSLAETVARLETRVAEARDELAMARSTMLEAIATEAARRQELTVALGDLSPRLAALEAAGVQQAAALDERATLDREEVSRMRTAVLRLERQSMLEADEFRRLGVALLERIEGARPA